MSLPYIGSVHSTRTTVRDDNWDSETSHIELSAEFPEDALAGLADFSHAEILFYMHQVDPARIEVSARHPRNNPQWPKVGIFAQRAKNRPNPIGLTVCEILKVEGRRLHLRGLDAVDGTPVLDIKPWMKEFAPRSATRQPAWATELMRDYWQTKAAPHAEIPEDIAKTLEAEKTLRVQGKTSEADEVLARALRDHPHSAPLHYRAACICDSQGRETQAVPHYLQALAGELSEEDRCGAFLGLGSTYRCLGEYQKSKDIFEKALKEFPNHRPYKVFMALTEWNLGHTDKSIEILLGELLDTTSDPEIAIYQRALRFYSTRLREIFK